MAVDLLTSNTETPIIVGDDADLSGFQRCFISVNTNPCRVELFRQGEDPSSDAAGQSWELAETTAQVLLYNEFVLLVCLAPDNRISQAILTPINDTVSPVRALSEAEIRTIAEANVSKDFYLQFLSGEDTTGDD